jgi:hypothetical protein
MPGAAHALLGGLSNLEESEPASAGRDPDPLQKEENGADSRESCPLLLRSIVPLRAILHPVKNT